MTQVDSCHFGRERCNRQLRRGERRRERVRHAHNRRQSCITAVLHSNRPMGSAADGLSGTEEVTNPGLCTTVPLRRTPATQAAARGIHVGSHLPSVWQQEPPPPATQAGTWHACLLPGLPHHPEQLKPCSGSSRLPGLTDKTPTVLAQAVMTPVSPEPHAKEHSLAAFDKGTCQNTVSDSYNHVHFETVNFSCPPLTTPQAPMFSSSFPATAAGLFL